MRRLLFVVAVAGCTHAGSSGPQWPKTTASEHDGGESLAPRDPAKEVAVAAAPSDDDADKPAATDTAEAPPAAASATEGAAPSAPATAQPEDVIQSDEIVIEVGPDD